jgi:NADPH-dependent curcumin reductase CurA
MTATVELQVRLKAMAASQAGVNHPYSAPSCRRCRGLAQAKVLADRVVGNAGSPAKVRQVTGRLGFDYHDGPVGKLLAKAAPDDIDATLDGVGGDHLEAAIESSRGFGQTA